MSLSLEMYSVTRVQVLGEAVCISYRTDILGKDRNLTLAFLALDKLLVRLWSLLRGFLLYTDDYVNNNNNTLSFQIQTGFFLSAFSPWRHKESDTIHKNLCKPYYTDIRPRTARLVVSKISTHLCWSWPKLIWSDLIRSENPTAHFNGRTSTPSSSKSPNSQDHPFRVWRQPPTQITPASFPVWEFIKTDDDCQIHLRAGVQMPV